MNPLKVITSLSVMHPKKVIAFFLGITLLFAIQFPRMVVDTDPENMLPEDEPARISHREIKSEFILHDAIVVGMVNTKKGESIFIPETLENIRRVTDEILGIDGVVASDVVSLSTTDNIEAEGGLLRIEPLLTKSIIKKKQAERIRNAVLDNPILKDLLVSGDGKAVAIYVPIKRKDESYRISNEIRKIIDKVGGDEEYYITGLPVAEDTFGVEMFRQMAISAPLAGLIVFLLMLFFFKRLSIVASPMIVAIMSIIWAMGLLIGMGYTVHIMSSMIPIFLMPIAVVDSIHILSEFHDRYGIIKDKRRTILAVMDELFVPMFYTSLTSMVGFASLSLTPIPPVRVFGLFVAFGIAAAWLQTVSFIPAFVMLLPERFIHGFGHKKKGGLMSALQKNAGEFTVARSKLIVILAVLLLIVSIYGIGRVKVNDNPVKWFHRGHPIRVADRVLNSHFGGTYMTYLVMEGSVPGIVKEPRMLDAMDRLQRHLKSLNVVGKTTSILDVVKRIAYELHDRDARYNAVPDTREAVSQYLFLYEMSGDPNDLLHLMTPDGEKASIWVQLKSGDNIAMRSVEESVNGYLRLNGMPDGISLKWAGLPYLNVIWQERMVSGMLKALLGSFITVFLLMIILFRSLLWGAIAMLPLTVTITFIYGMVGFIGKAYDMPIAVLSALTLGLSIDFAIHLCQRMRQILKEGRNLTAAMERLFKEPVRAIMRNAVVIALGFIPLVIAPLVPYQTVGYFLASIMFVSALTTIVVLPALITLLKGALKIG